MEIERLRQELADSPGHRHVLGKSRAMGLLAQFAGGLLDVASWRPPPGHWRRALLLVAIVLMAIHVVVAPVRLIRSVEPFGRLDAVSRPRAPFRRGNVAERGSAYSLGQHRNPFVHLELVPGGAAVAGIRWQG